MGITIHYRGTIDDIGQIEQMEDRMLDLVFSLGGRATIWRSFADHDRSRVVRGMLINLEPGQETFSLLISPEGHIISLLQIAEAENRPFDDPPFCSVKTQFGTWHGHVAIVLLLDAIRRKYFSNLTVSDEGDYYESRNLESLKAKLQFLDSAIHSLADGIREYGLSDEAAEDPNILASRIQRIAALVHQSLHADPSEPKDPDLHHNEASSQDGQVPSLDEEVQIAERLQRQNDLRIERMLRLFAEAGALGMSTSEAFELAMQDEGLSLPLREDEWSDSSFSESRQVEEWFESLPTNSVDGASHTMHEAVHPAVQLAQSFVDEVMDLVIDHSKPSTFLPVIARAGLEMVGGLVQATSGDCSDISTRAVAITQLKRALIGHGFARGAISGLRSDGTIDRNHAKGLHVKLGSILTQIHTLAAQVWTME